MPKEKKTPEVKLPPFPPCDISLGKSAYIKLCKAVNIPPSHAVRQYGVELRKFKREVMGILRSSTPTSFRKRAHKVKPGKAQTYGVSYFGRIG